MPRFKSISPTAGFASSALRTGFPIIRCSAGRGVVFEGVVAKCIAAGLVGGEAFSVDASLIKADVDKRKRVPGDQPIAWPKAEEASHAVREYLAALDAARSSEDNDDGDGGGSSGSRSKPAKEVSLTDPQAAWVTRPGIDPFFAYDANYLIDNKVGIIIDAEGTRANRVVEIAVTQTMVGSGPPPLRSSAPKARRRHRLWRGQAAQVADGSQDRTARSGVG